MAILSRFGGLFAIGIICGTINSLTIKFSYQTKAIGINGQNEYFHKPWFSTLVMFISMSCALPIHFYCNRKLPHHQVPDEVQDTKITARLTWAVFFPSMCDLLGTSLQQIGLIYIDLSVYQMLKGSILLFSAILSVIFLKRRLRTHNWIGLAVSCVALAIVGISSVWSRTAKAAQGGHVAPLWEQLLGIAVIIAGQTICASQYVVEEYLLKPPNTAQPLVLVGLEGIWGILVMMAIVLPIFQYLPGNDVGGTYENTIDSVVKISENPALMMILSVSFVSVLLYNIVGVMITAESSCIHHTFLDAMRTILIWFVSVVFFYVNPLYGEPWTIYSWLQLCGFFLLVSGQMIYDEIIRVPGVLYDIPEFNRESIRAGSVSTPNSRFVSSSHNVVHSPPEHDAYIRM
eukprot:GEMP01018012.1.p1 GENE.GEMP01018012.1~~GEMP01018012.1.p1  ORF type:complete len:402 (+),score=61.52 GEMP01018012.1:150-1355(+)